VSDWFTQIVGKRLYLVRKPLEHKREVSSRFESSLNGTTSRPTISYTNEAQFLLISHSSTIDLGKRSGLDSKLSTEVFRPNFVIASPAPYQEDHWRLIKIGTQYFRYLGLCNRCQMICIDKETLTVGVEPLKTLTSYRRVEVLFMILNAVTHAQSNVFFGVLLVHDPALSQQPYKFDPHGPVEILESAS